MQTVMLHPRFIAPRRRLLLLAGVVVAAAVPAPASAATAPVPCVVSKLVEPLLSCSEHGDTSPPAQRPAASACADAMLKPARGRERRLAAATVCLVNVERRKRGLTPLRRSDTLGRAASSYARRLIEYRFFAHVSPNGSTLSQRVGRTGYTARANRWWLGENLAWGTGDIGSPAGTVRAWMRSPGHRRNMLQRRFREIGVGAAIGIPVRRLNAATGATYAHVFGRRVR